MRGMRLGWIVVVLRLAASAVVSPAPAVAQLEPAGDVVGVAAHPNAIDLTLTSGALARLEAIDPGIVRGRVAPTGALSQRSSLAVRPSGLRDPQAVVWQDADAAWLQTAELIVRAQKVPFGLTVFDTQGNLLSADAPPSVAFDRTSGLILAQRYALDDEGYFGLGERGGPVNRRGRHILMRNTDQDSWTEFTDPHYQSYPFYYSVRAGRAYGLFLDAAAYSVFDMAANDPGIVAFGAVKGELDYYVLAGPAPAAVASHFQQLCGPPALPPLWTLGYNHAHYGWMTRDEVLHVAADMRQNAIPCDSLWFDIDYMTNYNHFTWDPVRFADPAGMMQQLHSAGFHTVAINEPCVVTADPLVPSLIAQNLLMKNIFAETVENSIFLGNVHWLDFSKQATRDWYRQNLARFIGVGIDGLWNDLNEPAANLMPLSVCDFDGDPREDDEFRNIYALIENEMAFDAMNDAHPGGRPWMLSRSGFSGIHRYGATWSGDSLSDFDTLRVCVQMSCSMGLSGVAQFGHDVGGFLGSPDAELFLRWLEFGSMTMFLRNHSVNTAPPREPWVFGEPWTGRIRSCIEDRYRLIPYLYSLLDRERQSGMPPLTPTVFEFPEDRGTFTQSDAFMLGQGLLVAPVFQRAAATRTVYLPGTLDWFDIRTDEQYSPGVAVTIDAPLGRAPALAKAGTVLVHGEPRQYTGAPGSPDLTVDLYPGSTGSFTLYEDDGQTQDFGSGIFLRTRIDHAPTPGAWTVNLTRIEGSWLPPSRSWTIIFHAVDAEPSHASIDGGLLPLTPSGSWSYDAVRKQVRVRFTDSTPPRSLFLDLRTPPSCPQDVNRDGIVNTIDLALLLGHFGQPAVAGADGDVNRDGVVNTFDLVSLLGAFGQVCPP